MTEERAYTRDVAQLGPQRTKSALHGTFRRPFSRIWILIWVAFGVVAAGEIVLRVNYFEQLRERSYPLIYQPHESVGYSYIPGRSSRLCFPSICKDVRVNREGFLGPAVDRNKSAKTFRVAVVDSSMGTGIWLNEGKSYSRHLEELLAPAIKQHPGRELEVLNFSVDGSDRSYELVRWAQLKAVGYSPDFLLIRAELPLFAAGTRRISYRGYVINYYPIPGSLENAKRRIDYLERHHAFKFAYSHSYIVRAIAKKFVERYNNRLAQYLRIFIEKRVPEGLAVRPYSLSRSLAILAELDDALRSNGGRLILVNMFGDPAGLAAAKRLGLLHITARIPPTSMRHELDNHWNDQGQRFLASELRKELTKLLSNPELVKGPK